MTPTPKPETEFASAANNWNLEKLYEDLAFEKKRRLTPAEKLYLRGLLCGYTPKEIATIQNIASNTVSQTLCKGPYRYIEALLERQTGKTNINWTYLIDLLTQAGYKKSFIQLESYPRKDWGEAPDTSVFYGRTEELAILKQWIVGDRCRIVALLGMGGIGKTTLAAKLAREIQDEFDAIIWRSLRHAPPFQEILANLIKFLSDEGEIDLPKTASDRLSCLMKYLQNHRCLIILDEWETILRSEDLAGQYREGYEDYGELIQRVGKSQHQSCLLLTSREKPQQIVLLEGRNLPVRSQKLTGLQKEDAKKIFQDKGFSGSENCWSELIHKYQGNPAALNFVAATIQEIFDGRVSQFLKQSTLVLVDSLKNILNEQFERLSLLEKEIMYWLAIEVSSVSMTELQRDIWYAVAGTPLSNAMNSLKGRSLLEQEINAEGDETLFTLQPAVKKYVINKLIERVSQEIFIFIETGDIDKIGLLRSHALVKERSPNSIKEIQTRLILKRIKDKLPTILTGTRSIEEQLSELLEILDSKSPTAIGYAKKNIIKLLAEGESPPFIEIHN